MSSTLDIKRTVEFEIPIGEWKLVISQSSTDDLVCLDLCWKDKQSSKHSTAVKVETFLAIADALSDNIPSSDGDDGGTNNDD
jgi:hypothetical protein